MSDQKLKGCAIGIAQHVTIDRDKKKAQELFSKMAENGNCNSCQELQIATCKGLAGIEEPQICPT